ncbi:hypothetical protein KDA11_03840 [Candidatus Saccharibacteria bacterium]|nr:hypothetical protein [Candidatus Saccharibacteria bacterium]
MQNDENTQPSVLKSPNNLPPTTESGISWTASEFVAYSKSLGWYAILGIGAILLAGALYILGKDIVAPISVITLAILFGIIAAKKPRELTYAITEDGVRVGEKLYLYNAFKSFSVIQEEGIESIWLMPLQRFMPGLSIYFAPDDGERIVQELATYLPFEPRNIDFIDKLMHKIRY